MRTVVGLLLFLAVTALLALYPLLEAFLTAAHP